MKTLLKIPTFNTKTLSLLVVGFAVLGVFMLIRSFAATPNSFDFNAEKKTVTDINNHRVNSHGQKALFWNKCLTEAARNWSKKAAADGQLVDTDHHNSTNMHADVKAACGTDFSGGWGETLAAGSSESGWTQWKDSPGHHAIIHTSAYDYVGLGAWVDSKGIIWHTGIFINCDSCSGSWKTAATAPVPPHDVALVGDWDSNGTVTPGVQRGNLFLLNNSNDGTHDISFNFGNVGDIPLAGDWDGDGKDTIGVKRGNVYYLTNQTPPVSVTSFAHGQATDIPLAGDWDGDGKDTIGLFRAPNTWYVTNQNPPQTTISFPYGISGDIPVAGDWDGDGKATPGVVRNGNQWFLNNKTDCCSDIPMFAWGSVNHLKLTGDWDGDGKDTPGGRDKNSNTWYLSNQIPPQTVTQFTFGI